MAARKKQTAMDLIVAELKENKDVVYGTVRIKAEKRGFTIYPVMFGRAKLMLGLVKGKKRRKKAVARRSASRTKKTTKRRPGRPKGSRGGSKSDRVRQLLASGMAAAQIAKKVGCSRNLVYSVKARQGSSKTRSKRGPRRPTKAIDLNSLIASLRAVQNERDRLKRTVERIAVLLRGIA